MLNEDFSLGEKGKVAAQGGEEDVEMAFEHAVERLRTVSTALEQGEVGGFLLGASDVFGGSG